MSSTLPVLRPHPPSAPQFPPPYPPPQSPWLLRIYRSALSFIHRRTILVLAVLFLAGVGGSLLSMSRLSESLIQRQAEQSSRLYVQAMQEARSLYATEAVARLRGLDDIEITPNYATQDQGAIPVPATYLIELGHTLSHKEPGMSVRLFSDFPFPNRAEEGGPRDGFETQALEKLRRFPNRPVVEFTKIEGRPSLRYAEADIMRSSCVSCHNTLPNSPKKDWKVGDVRGVLEITTPLDKITAETQRGLSSLTMMMGLLSLLALSGIAVVIGRLRNISRELELKVAVRTEELEASNFQLETEQERSEGLLLNILPSPVADRLKRGDKPIADGFASATVLFADLVNFTQLAEQISPTDLVVMLNEIFSRFDALSEQYGLEKIKTIGDAYMVVGGLPKPTQNHAEAIAEMALAMRAEIISFNALYEQNVDLRIGINTGPVVAGVIGEKKFIYDLWGDTVNVASRMESHGIPGEIQVTEATHACLRDAYFMEPRGLVTVKGKGEIATFWLKGRREVLQPLVRS